MISTDAAQYSISHTRPTKSLAILAIFKDFNTDDIEVVHNDTVKGYNIPLPISSVLDRIRAGGHTIEKLNDVHYEVRCFDQYDFTVLSTEVDSTTVLL